MHTRLVPASSAEAFDPERILGKLALEYFHGPWWFIPQTEFGVFHAVYVRECAAGDATRNPKLGAAMYGSATHWFDVNQ